MDLEVLLKSVLVSNTECILWILILSVAFELSCKMQQIEKVEKMNIVTIGHVVTESDGNQAPVPVPQVRM